MKRFTLVLLVVMFTIPWGFLPPKVAFGGKVDAVDEWEKLPLGDKWVTSITIDSNDSKVIYVTTLLDGVWKTIDGGKEWFQILYYQRTTFSCSALDVQNNILYIGSGAGSVGRGIFKSTNSGKNWIKLAIKKSIHCLKLDAQNPWVIYIGTARGVFKSTDGGENWKAINSGLTKLSISALAIDSQNTQIIYIGTWEQGVFKSIDGGENWVALDKGLLSPRVDSIVIDPTNHQVIYAATGLYGETLGNGVFKSIDGGENWVKINKGLTCLSMRSFAIDSTHTQVIYVGTQGQGVFKSIDGGENWVEINKGLTSLNVDSLAIDPTDSRIIYAGTFHPGGLFKSVVNTYRIITSTTTGGVITPSGSVSVDYGQSQNFTITPDTGYKIKDVKVDGASVGAVTTYTFENVTSDHTIEAIFEPITYLITASAGIDGSVSPSGTVTLNYGDSKTFTITPNTGYIIKDVKVDGASVGAVTTYTFENVTSSHIIEAMFEPITYSITTSAGSGGSISPLGTVKIKYGDSKTFTIIPNSGYKISNVKVDGVSVGAVSSYTFNNVTSDHTISVAFEKEITETVIILQIGNSTFTVNGISNTLDSPPIIKNSRTLLPIRAIIEALGGTVGWDTTAKKVTVTLGSTTIELWIGKSIAKVNGVDTSIDSANPKVVPEIINSRTMLPLRFIAENLGCDVQWDGTTKTITITYLDRGG